MPKKASPVTPDKSGKVIAVVGTPPPGMDFDDAQVYYPLLYRPTCKLVPVKTSYEAEAGDWCGQKLRDKQGRIYLRERKGNWERWWVLGNGAPTVSLIPGARRSSPTKRALACITDLDVALVAFGTYFWKAVYGNGLNVSHPVAVDRVSKALTLLATSLIDLFLELDGAHRQPAPDESAPLTEPSV